MNYINNSQINVKSVILGETRVGKTSLSNRYFTKNWNPLTNTTISASCQKIDLNIDNLNFTFCLWDTAGQERFRSISPIYYRGSHVAIVVFDLTFLDSIKIAKSWINELRKQGPIGVPIVILGNKSDLKEEIVVSEETIKELSNSIGADYFEVSALNGKNVEESFLHAANLGLKYYKDQQQLSMPISNNNNSNNIIHHHNIKIENSENGKSCCK